MGKVNVIIVDATGNKEQRVGLPDDIKCGIIMVKLIEKIKLPSVGPDGNPISYKFIHKVTGRQLLETQTLAEAGIHDGDVLRLQPEITAGAVCGKCGAPQPDGATYCDRCGSSMTASYQSAPVYNPAPPVYSNAGYAPAQKEPSKIVLIFGIIAMVLLVLSYLIQTFGEITDSDTYKMLSFMSSLGGFGFMTDIVLYMFYRLKKQD